MNALLQIGQRAGVSAKTIRYYGQVRLLPEPVRSESGYRLYRIRETIRRRLGEVDRQLAELNQLKRELGRLEAVARSLPSQPETPARFCHILDVPAG